MWAIVEMSDDGIRKDDDAGKTFADSQGGQLLNVNISDSTEPQELFSSIKVTRITFSIAVMAPSMRIKISLRLNEQEINQGSLVLRRIKELFVKRSKISERDSKSRAHRTWKQSSRNTENIDRKTGKE